MKTLILLASLLVMLSTSCNKQELIRPKGSDTEWQQRQEQEELHRRMQTDQQQYQGQQREREINFTPANN